MEPHRLTAQAQTRSEKPSPIWGEEQGELIEQRVSMDLIFFEGTVFDQGGLIIPTVNFLFCATWEQKTTGDWFKCAEHQVTWWEKCAHSMAEERDFYPYFERVEHGLQVVTSVNLTAQLNESRTQTTGGCPSELCAQALMAVKRELHGYVSLIKDEQAAK